MDDQKTKKRVRHRVHGGGRGPQSVATPAYVLRFVQSCLGPGYYDPCPLEPTVDGLSVRWKKKCYVNPPFSSIKHWLDKSWHEVNAGGADEVWVFIPFLPHHNYWDWAVFGRASQVWVVTNPVTFVGYTNRCAEAMCFVVFSRGHQGQAPRIDWLQIPGWDDEHYKGKTKRRVYRASHGR